MSTLLTLLRHAIKFVIVAGLIVVAVVAVFFIVWMIFRFNLSFDTFTAVRDQMRNDLGLSTAMSQALGGIAGTACFALLVMLFYKPKIIFPVFAGLLVSGVPLAMLYDSQAASNCFDRQTDAALCSSWELPDGSRQIVRKDAASPPATWTLVRLDATHDDAKSYGSRNEIGVNSPKVLTMSACNTNQPFFDATGRAIVFYSREGDNFVLWTRRGTHPFTGVQLDAITPDVAQTVCNQLAAAALENERRLMASTNPIAPMEHVPDGSSEPQSLAIAGQPATSIDLNTNPNATPSARAEPESNQGSLSPIATTRGERRYSGIIIR